MSIPEVEEVFWSIDSQELARAARGLIGQRCWKARFTYGDEFSLHLGDRVPFSSPRIAGQHGAWILSTRASDWKVRRDQQAIASSDGREAAEGILPGMIHGAAVSTFGPSGDDSGLRVTFDNESVLEIVPADDEDWDLAAWDLFTPAGLVIERGPGTVWGKWRSDRRLDFIDAVRETQRCWTELLASNGQLSDWRSPWNAESAESPDADAANGEVFFSAVSGRLRKAVLLVRTSDASPPCGRPKTSTGRFRLSDQGRGEYFTAVCGPKGMEADTAARLSSFLQAQPVGTGRTP